MRFCPHFLVHKDRRNPGIAFCSLLPSMDEAKQGLSPNHKGALSVSIREATEQRVSSSTVTFSDGALHPGVRGGGHGVHVMGQGGGCVQVYGSCCTQVRLWVLLGQPCCTESAQICCGTIFDFSETNTWRRRYTHWGNILFGRRMPLAADLPHLCPLQESKKLSPWASPWHGAWWHIPPHAYLVYSKWSYKSVEWAFCFD